MRLISTILGTILCLTALIGVFQHNFMGMALGPLQDTILLAMGGISLYFGIQGTEFEARNMCQILGVVFGIAGLATLMSQSGVATAGGVNIQAQNVLHVIPGKLDLTTADGIRNLLIGMVGLVAGFMPRELEIEIDTRAQKAQLEIAKKH